MLNVVSVPPTSTNSVLLQALINQAAPPVHSVPRPSIAPVLPTMSSNNQGALNQLAQILQNRGIDANTLGALLSKDSASSSQSQAKPTYTNYSTTYPTVSSYDYSYNNKQSSSYGPSKDDDPKRSYRPY